MFNQHMSIKKFGPSLGPSIKYVDANFYHPPLEHPKILFSKPWQYGCSDERKGLVSYRKLGFRSLRSFVKAAGQKNILQICNF